MDPALARAAGRERAPALVPGPATVGGGPCEGVPSLRRRPRVAGRMR
ncbi:hypothetical protein [Streptomyces sp. NPDC102283]